MENILNKRVQRRHNAFVKRVRIKVNDESLSIVESEIRKYLGQYMDIERAVDAFIEQLSNEVVN